MLSVNIIDHVYESIIMIIMLFTVCHEALVMQQQQKINHEKQFCSSRVLKSPSSSETHSYSKAFHILYNVHFPWSASPWKTKYYIILELKY